MRRGSATRVSVRLTPRAQEDGFDRLEMIEGKPLLHLRVRALPDKGSANLAAAELIARLLDLSQNQVRLTSGSRSRLKRFTIDLDEEALEARLKNLGDT